MENDTTIKLVSTAYGGKFRIRPYEVVTGLVLFASVMVVMKLDNLGLLDWLLESSVPAELLLGVLIMMPVWVAAYFLFLGKPRRIDLSDKTVSAKRFLRKPYEFPACAIRSYRRNVLGERLLYDEDGKRLLTVPCCMTNLDQFQDWLERRGIEQR